MPKIALVRLADTLAQTNTKLSTLAQKLQNRITDAKNAGKNVDALQSQLNSMDDLITEAGITANSLQTKLIALQPTDYNNDRTIITSYRNQLTAIHQQNVSALSSARAIVSGLKATK